MKKIIFALISSLVMTLLIGCGGTENVKESIVCVFPDDPTVAAPEWICNPSIVTGDKFSAVAARKNSSMCSCKYTCLDSARMKMKQMLKTSVDGMFQQYAESTGSGDQETIDQMKKTVTEQLTKAIRLDTSSKRVTTSPKGTIYCLVAMEISKEQAIANAAHEAAKNSTGNQKALWDKFQEKMSIEEMVRKLEEQEQ